ncbi:Helitron helicase-like protein [Phytophthora palmivora]|uniref:ATP-dependent DNA helicase n=1 Tax=Phytophthora palmivora TaxID=4796 RepID=A0A2P4X096_9STRA|nr:Helitron helicase-like protein [Phytophthora palmivora]
MTKIAMVEKFSQFLPVVKKDTSVKTIDSCLKSSELWNHFEQSHLTENIRAHVAESDNTAEECVRSQNICSKLGRRT